jgi:hypothetical protein
VLLCASAPAFAQVDFTGVWNGNTNAEDGPERAQGPSLVEFLGLPINDQARAWGLAYRPGRLSLIEHQCQVHVVHYIHRGPFGARIWEERDPVTHQLIAIHEAINTYEQKRTIWMDGRPHPSPNAPHTWMGFSTGVWEGNMRSPPRTSAEVASTRTFQPGRSDVDQRARVRNGNVGPISASPGSNSDGTALIAQRLRTLNASPNFNPFWPCEYIDEGEKARGEVPHYLPGENPWVAEYAATHLLPQEVTLGGASQMYPEYRVRLKTLPVAVFTSPDDAPPAAAPARGRRGSPPPAAPAGGGRGGSTSSGRGGGAAPAGGTIG